MQLDHFGKIERYVGQLKSIGTKNGQFYNDLIMY